jgi:hypothetical protein
MDELGRLGRLAGTEAVYRAHQIEEWISMATWFAVLWPIAMILAALCGSSDPNSPWWTPTVAQTLVPIIALTPLVVVVLLGIRLVNPLTIAVFTAFPKLRKPLTWIGMVLMVELSIGTYLTFVPIAQDRALVLPLILVAITLGLSKILGMKGWIIKLLVGLVILLTLIFFLGGRSGAKEKTDNITKALTSSTQPQISYNPHDVCTNAWDADEMEENDHSKEDVDYFDVKLSNGCFSGYVRPPDTWGSWDFEFVSHEPNRHFGFWFPNSEFSIGPFFPGQNPDLRYHPRSWRNQGVGTFRYFRTDHNK